MIDQSIDDERDHVPMTTIAIVSHSPFHHHLLALSLYSFKHTSYYLKCDSQSSWIKLDQPLTLSLYLSLSPPHRLSYLGLLATWAVHSLPFRTILPNLSLPFPSIHLPLRYFVHPYLTHNKLNHSFLQLSTNRHTALHFYQLNTQQLNSICDPSLRTSTPSRSARLKPNAL